LSDIQPTLIRAFSFATCIPSPESGPSRFHHASTTRYIPRCASWSLFSSLAFCAICHLARTLGLDERISAVSDLDETPIRYTRTRGAHYFPTSLKNTTHVHLLSDDDSVRSLSAELFCTRSRTFSAHFLTLPATTFAPFLRRHRSHSVSNCIARSYTSADTFCTFLKALGEELSLLALCLELFLAVVPSPFSDSSALACIVVSLELSKGRIRTG
jgi:hypothetical protein